MEVRTRVSRFGSLYPSCSVVVIVIVVVFGRDACYPGVKLHAYYSCVDVTFVSDLRVKSIFLSCRHLLKNCTNRFGNGTRRKIRVVGGESGENAFGSFFRL